VSTPKTETEDRHFTHGSSASAVGHADAGAVKPEDRAIHATDTPAARLADEPLKDGEKHDQLADKEAASEDRQEALIDESIEESFPASDPPSPKHIT
jgi:hypothetical protein